MKERVIAIVGPTAVGKTKLSIALAKALNAEIISGDSAQVYRGLNIGTAKITPEEMEGIPHHLLDLFEPTEQFTVYDFQQLAREKIREINARGKVPLIVGGTGLYIRAALYDYLFTPGGRDLSFEHQFNHLSNEALHALLASYDPEGAQAIHPNNRRRILRKLDILRKGGTFPDQPPRLLYDALIIGLTMDRERLYQRIEQRVDEMVERGLIEEAKALFDRGILPNIIGYKEFIPYFKGEASLMEALATLKKNTRRLAKRQLSFFRNQFPELVWVSVDEVHFDRTIEEVKALVFPWLAKFK